MLAQGTTIPCAQQTNRSRDQGSQYIHGDDGHVSNAGHVGHIVSVLGGDEGYTAKYGLNPRVQAIFCRIVQARFSNVMLYPAMAYCIRIRRR